MEKGANGIVGINFDYKVLGEANGTMLAAISDLAGAWSDMT